ncbi:hypothetical protein MOMA_08911 [Moraxella macacae 0408225]|uniref:Uncharacterized protein n=1 Tax=Moraxella macacae 0408225 TaxID=1230338 RepID=L2F7D2_9GAMM|nr:type IV pilus biogenesis/stability protein PilW [Moraxella macacae]ELA08666.1 hypothetical protein MOMA_08911 [Moraxella macacae 0408225]
MKQLNHGLMLDNDDFGLKKWKKNVLASLVVLGMSVIVMGCSQSQTISSQTITSSDPSRWIKDPKEIARSRTAIAAQFIREHRLDDAKRQLEQALKSDPNSPQAHDMMGVLLQQEGSALNLQKAQAYFKKALELDPDFTQAHNNYGVYLAKVKRYSEAIAQFEIAGSTLGYEGRADALENLGRMYLQVNDTAKAKEAFGKALDANRYSVIARSEMIDIFINEKQTLNAKKLHADLMTILGEEYLDPRTLQQGARLAKLTGNNTELQKFSQQLLDKFPTSSEAKQLKQWLRTPNAVWK